MSRIGKLPIQIPSGVRVSISGRDVVIEAGDKRLSCTHRPEIAVRYDEAAKQIIVERRDDQRQSRAYHGLTRALIQNMVDGVTKGFSKTLEITGVGWAAQVKGRTVELNVGYADAKVVPIPLGVTVEVKASRLTISGPDRQAVGQCAAQIRAMRKPEPYSGKGIRYSDEVVIRKQGKAFATGAT